MSFCSCGELAIIETDSRQCDQQSTIDMSSWSGQGDQAREQR